MNKLQERIMDSDLSHYYDVKEPKDLKRYVKKQMPKYMLRLSRKNVCDCVCSYCDAEFVKNIKTDNHICPHCHSHLIPKVISSKTILNDKLSFAIAGRQKYGKSIDFYIARREIILKSNEIKDTTYFEHVGRTVMDMDGRRCYKWYGVYYYCDWHQIDTIWDEFYCHPSVNKVMGLNMPTNEPIAIDYYLYNLEKYPMTKVLYEKGFKSLACSTYPSRPVNSKSMANFLDVNPNMVPKLAEINASPSLVRFVSINNINCSLDTLKKMVPMVKDYRSSGFVSGMTAEKYVNYYAKQKEVTNEKLECLYIYYEDYLSMAKELKIDLSHKTNLYPQNIVKEHDRLVKIRAAVKEELLAKRQEEIFEMSKVLDEKYSNDDFCVVIPSTFDEFVVEGQSLHHCVGSSKLYYNRHCDGESLIAFIRHKDNPSKPFFTLELDMFSFKIKQLYGYGDCKAPSDVRKFTEAFALKLKRNIEKRVVSVA